MVVAVVEPVNHGGVFGQFNQEVPVVAEGVLAEHVYLVDNDVVVVDLGLAGGEEVVPEEDHLLFEGPTGVDESVEPGSAAHAWGGDGAVETGVIAQELEPVGLIAIGVHQLVDGGIVAFGYAPFQLLAAGAETGSAHKVSHQGYIVTSHTFLLFI